MGGETRGETGGHGGLSRTMPGRIVVNSRPRLAHGLHKKDHPQWQTTLT